MQISEALGRAPTLRKFGRTKFEWLAPLFGTDVVGAWQSYGIMIDHVLQAGE